VPNQPASGSLQSAGSIPKKGMGRQELRHARKTRGAADSGEIETKEANSGSFFLSDPFRPNHPHALQSANGEEAVPFSESKSFSMDAGTIPPVDNAPAPTAAPAVTT
jgi:hypothetical protein